MTSRDFAYWLQGYFELSGVRQLSTSQAETIANHLALVFKHEIDPLIGGDAEELQAIHDGTGAAETLSKPTMHGNLLARC